jgi:hypothetical protein
LEAEANAIPDVSRTLILPAQGLVALCHTCIGYKRRNIADLPLWNQAPLALLQSVYGLILGGNVGHEKMCPTRLPLHNADFAK